jgi:predicted TIM-barrel fold metal-dependent hydrolase
MATIPYRIDVHHHIVPKEYLLSLADMGITTAGGVIFPKWDVQDSLAYMDQHNIATTLFSISAPGIYFGNSNKTIKLAIQCNDISTQIIKDHPARFGAFAVLPLPNIEASILELERALEDLKLDGVGLLSNIEGKYLGDPIFDELFAELNRRNAVVFIHPNTPPEEKMPDVKFRGAMLEFVFDTTRAATNLVYGGAVKRFPNIKFILPHAGGTVPFLGWRISFGKKKILNGLKSFYYDTAVSGTNYALHSLKEFVDPSHILFGTDFPFLPQGMINNMITGLEQYAGFDNETRMMIMRENALTLFPRLSQG